MGQTPQHDDFRRLLARRIDSFRALEAQVRERLLDLQEELSSIERRLRAAEDLYQAEYGHSIGPGSFAEPPGDPSVKRAGSLTGFPWGRALVRTLVDSGAPLHVKDIWAHMRANGFETTAKDPLRSIVAIAVRHPGIVKTAPNTYYLNHSLAPDAGTGDPTDGGNEEAI